MKLLFLHGEPGVGKLTVALELAKLTGFRLFHNHLTVDLVGSLFRFGSEPFVVLREQIWLSTFREAARHDVSLIFTFAPERTVREGFISDTLQVVESAGGKVIFVELKCSQDMLESRLANPSRSEFGKLNSAEQYRALKAAGAFLFPTMPGGLSLDTTHGSPSETAALINDYASNL